MQTAHQIGKETVNLAAADVASAVEGVRLAARIPRDNPNPQILVLESPEQFGFLKKLPKPWKPTLYSACYENAPCPACSPAPSTYRSSSNLLDGQGHQQTPTTPLQPDPRALRLPTRPSGRIRPAQNPCERFHRQGSALSGSRCRL